MPRIAKPDTVTGRAKALGSRLKVHTGARRRAGVLPTVHPQHAIPELLPHVAGVPARPASQPVGVSGSGSGTLPAGGAFGARPPATTNHWLNGVGGRITPVPAMSNTAVHMRQMGSYARQRTSDTWAYISRIRSTV